MLPKIKRSAFIAAQTFCQSLNNQFSRQLCTTFPPIQSKITSLISNGHLNSALLEMAIQGLEVKFEGYNALLNGCINKRALREGQRVHAHMIKTRYLPPVYLRTRLIVLYVKCECLIDARKVFDEMPERNVVSWTAMISGYSRNGFCFQALQLFAMMLRSGIEPNEFTFASILPCCIGEHGFNCGRQIHSLIIRYNYDAHIYVGSSLLDMYAKGGSINQARIVFDGLVQRDVVSCTSMIAGYAQLGFNEEAVELFRKLVMEGMNSNYVTYASLLNALSGLTSRDLGKQVHSHILRQELPSEVILQNSLIDMYAKCGNLVYSRRVFDSMPVRTVVSWNAILAGYSAYGMCSKMIDLFKLMREDDKVKPNCVTYLVVLSGCSHGGMENMGLKVFDEMVACKDGFEPNIEHYGCVVDLLGRCGRLEQALKFINEMPLKPTAAILGSFLGACQVHSNIDVGEFVGRQLLEMEPENARNYVILANLYASAGRWEEAKAIWKLMKGKAMLKKPGRSWMELDQTLHTLHSNDHLISHIV